MAQLTKQQIIKSFFKNTISEATFAELEKMGVLRSTGSNPDGSPYYDSRFLPPINPSLTALTVKLTQLEKAKVAEAERSEAEELERKVALRVEQQLSRERAKLRKSALTELSRALAESDED